MSDDSAADIRRLLIISVSVIASIVVPIIIVSAVSMIVFQSVPLGRLEPGLTVAQYVTGSLKDGELWFPLYSVKQPLTLELAKLNLTTKVQTATGIKIQQNYAKVEWMGDDLYWYNDTAIYRLRNDVLEQLPSFHSSSTTFQTNIFLFQGELSIIDETKPSDFTLFQLKDQKWIPAGKVLLPDPDKAIAARQTAQQQARTRLINTGGSQRRLTIKSDGNELHLFLRHAALTSPDSYYAAYRKGLELDPNQSDSPQPTDWADLPAANDSGHFIEMFCDQDGPIFLSYTSLGRQITRYQLVRRFEDGRMESLREQRSPDDNSLVDYVHQPTVWVFTGPQEQSYVMQSNGHWHGEQFRPINKTTIQPPILSMPDRKSDYISSRMLIGLSLLIAWLAHWLILLAGVDKCRAHQSQFEFGNQAVTLAPILRRSIAQLIDLSLIAIILAFSLWGHFHLLGVHWTPPKIEQLANFTLYFEQVALFRNQFGGWLAIIPYLPIHALQHQLFGTTPEPMMLAWAAAAALADSVAVFWCYQVYSEGRYGCSIGKWICGVHTLRTTLRKVGFARAIVRDVVRCVDFPFFLTPLPAAISMMKSPACQRIGDRYADAIVVRDHTLRDYPSASDEVSAPPTT